MMQLHLPTAIFRNKVARVVGLVIFLIYLSILLTRLWSNLLPSKPTATNQIQEGFLPMMPSFSYPPGEGPYLTFHPSDQSLPNANMIYNFPTPYYVNNQHFLYDIFFRSVDDEIILIGPGYKHCFTLLKNTTFYVEGVEIQQVKLIGYTFHCFTALLQVDKDTVKEKQQVLVEAPSIGLKIILKKTQLLFDRPAQTSIGFKNNKSNHINNLRVAAETIYRGDEELLPLWIAYHHKIGFNTFILYNNHQVPINLTNISLTKLIKPHILQERPVNIIVWTWVYPYWQLLPQGRINIAQVTAQNHALQRYQYDFDWIMMNDNDEYLVPKGEFNDVKNLLASVDEKYAAVSVETIWYGCPPSETHFPEFLSSGLVSMNTQQEEKGQKQHHSLITIIKDFLSSFFSNPPTTISYNTDNFILHFILRKPDTEGRYRRPKCIARPTLTNLAITHIIGEANGLVLFLDSEFGAWLNHYRVMTKVVDRKDCRIEENILDKRIGELWLDGV